ncbi:exopolysaccharide biosynthesis polyprenyl glycosylphosphotransferase [Nocardioides pinisoli]|uniref:Exopolysaccharide biosynthesis polyprenyl glycosylphosphotransferase n=1 Tax=Nocardioides pinisoli TaxID=2950279 RepID=A0ABT1L0A3_9ACTN|nr:exopolysaccharide biosynthesis polyprenyl glycosylphosphotransferase [Nocardioides pinisoli]MCP3423009.1 exopolysaccharide biosynthesis polyprenyl glycosylphosphotransferase [Nocardioides pinisoli]
MTQVVSDRVAEVVSEVAAGLVPDIVAEATADGALLDPQVPRPREATTLPPVAPGAAPAEPLADPAPRRTATRPAASWLAPALDLVLALALAVLWVSQDRLQLLPAAATALAWPALLAVSGRYRRQALGQSRGARAAVVLAAGGRTAVLTLAVSPLLWHADPLALAAFVGALTVASAGPFVAGVRRPRPRVVLAGRPRDVREAVAQLRASGTHEVVAACLTRSSKTPVEGDVPIYVGLEASSTAAHDHAADALVVLPGAKLSPVEVRRLHWSLSGLGTELFLGTGLLDVHPQRTRVMSTAGLDVLHVGKPTLRGPRRLLKDVVERTLALVALVLSLPLLAALAVAIRMETPGPAFFRQERIGRDGVPFTMLKLRSMGVDAEVARHELAEDNEKDGVLFKIAQDPRVTPLGSKLRRYSLDELPQLWNVVRGDMSLVGPRPALPCEVARYDVDPRRRLVVKPGVTGLWQVSGRSDLTWAESVRLDLRYVENWSLRHDLSILVRTVRAVLGHRGAY